MVLHESARLVPCRDVAVRAVDDGAVLVNMRSGACFELNRMGFQIWELLAKGASPSSICEALVGRYEVADEVLVADVRALLDTLVQRKLIESAPTG